MSSEPLFTIIYGPTASGKTALAYRVADQEANLLSFDSRHVYKEMNVVTGKDLHPDAYPVSFSFPNGKPYTVYAHHHITDFDELPSLQTLTHLTDQESGDSQLSRPLLFGLNIVSPDQEFSIRHYYEYAREVIQAHRDQKKPLILVGGSWLYAKVLLDPPDSLFAKREPQQREQLGQLSLEEMQRQVQERLPTRWAIMNHSDRSNTRRLIRILEAQTTGSRAKKPEPLIFPDEYDLRLLNPPIEELEIKIQTRIQERIEQGALEETQLLIKKYPDWSLPAFSSTGYVPLRRFLENEISLEEAKELWFLQERQYVKRQKTWIKKIVIIAS